MSIRDKIWNIIEYALGLVVLITLLLYVYLNMCSELRDPDIWLHLKTGEYIVQHRTIPYRDIFSSTVLGKQWIDHSWLLQVLFYLVFHLGGPDNLIFLSAITVTVSFLLLFFCVYKQRQHLAIIVSTLFITIFASRIRFNIRPENLSIFFFSLYLLLLTRHISKKWIFLLPLAQLIWVNCHGFFILGPLLVAVFILAEKLKRLEILPWEWNKIELLDTQYYRNLVRVFILVCLVSFINPYGYKGALYPLWVTFSSTEASRIFYAYIQELLPLWHFKFELASPYYILIAVSAPIFLLNFKRINIAYLMMWLIFLAISFRVNRNIIFFNFIAFLTISDLLTRGLNVKRYIFNVFFDKLKYLLRYALMIIIIVGIVKKNRSILESSYYIFEENRIKGSLLGVISDLYPNKAVDFILKNDLPDNIFNLFNHGSYFIYHLFPNKKVFIDGRTELYGGDFFINYQKILNVEREAIEDSFRRYNINTVVLSSGHSNIGELSRYLFDKPDWVLVYFDKDSMIFLKNTLQNETLITKLKVDLKKWQVPKADLEKIGIRNVLPQPYINRAWMFYYLGLDEQAIQEAKEALRILPSISDSYNIIGGIYTKQKLYDEAFEALRLAYIYGPSSKETLIRLGRLYMETGKIKPSIKTYKMLIKLHPCFSEGYYLLGQSYSQIGEVKQAIKLMKKAIKLNPLNANYYKGLGDLLYENKDFKGAIRVYKDALVFDLDPRDFHRRLDSIFEKIKTQNK